MPGPAGVDACQPTETGKCTVSFQNLMCKREVKVPKSANPFTACTTRKVRVTKQLLHNITGIMKPGLNAIIGPSGSGKSTLLNVLSGRIGLNIVTGSVYLNGVEKAIDLGGNMGYVTQNDCLMSVLTVKENIWFSANLRLPNSVKYEEKKSRVEKIISQLSLESCKDTKIGSEFIRGVSGGERKRTTIGMELVIQPMVLFLDEPTSGLDASTAQAVLILLKRISSKGTNIILTIHQPRYSIFCLFDSLTVIGKGKMIFHAPTLYLIPYFQSIGYECHEDENPADFVQDIVSGDLDVELWNLEAEKETLSQEQVAFHTERLATLFRSSWLHGSMVQEIHAQIGESDQCHNEISKFQESSFVTQTLFLSQRAFRNLIRNPMALVSNAIINLLIGFIFGLIYFQIDNLYSTGKQNRFGFIFFVCSNMLFGSLSAIELFVNEKHIFLHEHKSGHYEVLPYFLAKLFADLLPLRTISPLLFCCVTYWMVGLKPEVGAFFIFIVTVLLLVYAAAGIGMVYSASFQDYTTASVFITLTFVFAIMLNGFLINTDSILPWLRWIEYLSIARYGFTALCINEFSSQIFQDCIGISNYTENITLNLTIFTLLNDSSSTDIETMATLQNNDSCILVHGEEILLKQLALHPTRYEEITGWLLWQNHIALACMTVISFVLAYVQLARAAKRN